MFKLRYLLVTLTVAMVASSAFGQVSLPGGKRKLPDVPDIAALRIERNVDILQVMHCGPSDGSLLPPGIVDTSFCLDGPLGKTGNVTPTVPACRFVVWQRPVAQPCPKCGAPFLTQRGGRGKRFLACWREGCDYRREIEDA